MSFDKDDGLPIVNVHKRTTRVNLWMVVAVVAFLLFGTLAAFIII
jgi:hypothetical protein